MPEKLEIHLPAYMPGGIVYPNIYEIIPIQVPWKLETRAAFYHDLLTEIWRNGLGSFTSQDIFQPTNQQLINLDNYRREQTQQQASGYVTGGNITGWDSAINPAYEKHRNAIYALKREQIIAKLAAYLALPRPEALERTKIYDTWARPNPHTTSEAEYWLRHPVLRLQFSDDGEAMEEVINPDSN